MFSRTSLLALGVAREQKEKEGDVYTSNGVGPDSSSSVASSWALDMSVHICQVDVSVDYVYVYQP
jgi:hypothetical protein